MKRAKSKYRSQDGFTLIEIIATIIAMGILAAFFIHFMGTALNDSWRSVELVADEARAEGLMERIIADYVEQINDTTPDNALAAIKGRESTYESDVDYGMPVTMAYILFNDVSGDEEIVTVGGVSRNLKVTVESAGYH